ncbi:hypothetical protein F5Y01DRAFT_291348 [Xylaria sp. FL0043]|nr:hypothetical protein F5Y01DRAFT_291348 [Xylaria sp. FL0043]
MGISDLKTMLLDIFSSDDQVIAHETATVVLQQKPAESSHNLASASPDRKSARINRSSDDVEIHKTEGVTVFEVCGQAKEVPQPDVNPTQQALPRREECDLHEHEHRAKIDSLSADLQRSRKMLQQERYKTTALEEALKETKADLNRSNEELQQVQKRWRKVASQLDQLQCKEAVSMHHLADSDLIGLVRQLRFLIRSFSVQYFNGRAPRQARDSLGIDNFTKYMPEAIGHDEYYDYLLSDTKAPLVIQSFLWTFLVCDIFDTFCWVPRLRDSMRDLFEALRPVEDGGEASSGSDEEDQRFQTWKTATVALILSSKQEKKNFRMNDVECQRFAYRISTQILSIISPFARNEKGTLYDLQFIVENAIALDQEMSKQATTFLWYFNTSQCQALFDTEYMEEDTGETMPRPGQHVELVIEPALVKRVKHTGKSYKTEDWLVKMTVTCVPLSPESVQDGSNLQCSSRGLA